MIKRIDNRILVGAMYAPFCRTAHVPIVEWDSDLAKMKDAGFTCLHGFAEWHDIEYEKGRFDFSKIDCLVELSEKHGLVPIINIATQNSVGFYSPRWLMEEYRGVGRGFVDANGTSAFQGQFVVPCIDDPIYQSYAKRFLTETAKHFAGDSRVGGYVLWGEPMLFRAGSGAAICYCEHTVAKFREWLEERYGTIEALNAAWSSEGPADFIDFTQVQPPTGSSRQLGGFASWEDFRTLMEESLSGHIKAADDIFKANGATQPTIVEMISGLSNGIDIWKLSESTDIIGISCFDRPGRRTAFYMGMADSMAKALDRSIFVVEATGTSTKYTEPRSPSTNELVTTLLQRVASGAKGLMYWCWRPRMSDTEGNEFGMARPDGKVLRRTLEVGKVAARMTEMSDYFDSTERTSKVAIFSSQKINHLMGSEGMGDRYLSAGFGAAYLLADLHINADFINEAQLEAGRLERYNLLILPCSYILSEEVGAAIEKFVRNGGKVIADYLLAEKRPGGFCYYSLPGAGLDKVFGVERDDIRVIEHRSQLTDGAGIFLGGIMETIIPSSAKVLEEYKNGDPLITLNSYGNGSAVYFAGMYFAQYAKYPSLKLRERLAKLLEDFGILSEISLERSDKCDSAPQAITLELYDKASGGLAGVLVTNTDFGEISDRLVLPSGEWSMLKNGQISDLGECDSISIELDEHESILIFKK